jgi:hypothetical protein
MEFLIEVEGEDQKRTLVPDIDSGGENHGFKWVDEQGEEVALGGYLTEEEAAQAAHDAYRGWNLRWVED